MTPDVNILVAASRQDHPHHAPALTWLEQAIADSETNTSLAVLPMVASGFLRLVTHPRVFVQPTPLPNAQAFLAALLGAPGVSMLPLRNEWPYFIALCAQHKLTGNAIPDAWIAAAAHYHHLRLVTFDKGFRKLLKPSMVTVLKG
ncbi:TA system VapC family ribonuclease toxin [Thauera sp. SDU_THAU2]|uniref:TA system VapC family ribonuclease toxin n=1 Tax=Thauera sp. SDU_THAU2 TaxID=3136633 RepID=UPI00311F4F9A